MKRLYETTIIVTYWAGSDEAAHAYAENFQDDLMRENSPLSACEGSAKYMEDLVTPTEIVWKDLHQVDFRPEAPQRRARSWIDLTNTPVSRSLARSITESEARLEIFYHEPTAKKVDEWIDELERLNKSVR